MKMTAEEYKEKRKTYRKKIRDERVAAHRCVDCNEQIPEERKATRCFVCQKETVGARKRKQQKYRDAGLCLCGRERLEGQLQCSKCNGSYAKLHKQRGERLSKVGLCTHCGNEECLPALKDRPLKMQYGKKCYLKKTCARYFGSNMFWEKLEQKLIDQNYRCVYTGRTLVLGDNASLDHIKPKSAYPELKDDINNMEWVDGEINYSKWNRTPEQFISILNKIKSNNTHKNDI